MWLTTLLIFLTAVYLWYLWRKRHFSQLKKLGIPGPEPSFLFGNLFDMGRKNALDLQKEWIEKYGRVVGFFFGFTPIVLVADPELLKQVQISEFHKFINRPRIFVGEREKPKKGDLFSYQMTSLRDKRWKEIRSIITPSFTTKKMKMMAPSVNSAVDDLIENIEQKARRRESFDIYELYQRLSLDVIGRAAFGIQTNCQKNPEDPFLRASRVIFSGTLGNVFDLFRLSFPELKIFAHLNHIWLTIRNKGKDPLREVFDSVKSVMKTRRECENSRRQDLLQLMIDAHVPHSDLHDVKHEDLIANGDLHIENEQTDLVNGNAKPHPDQHRFMDDEEILGNTLLFFLAGYETTSTALAFTTHLLVHYPDVQEKVREEVMRVFKSEGTIDYGTIQKLHYLDQVVNESLRMYPPVHFFVSREVREDASFGNYRLKTGCCVQVPVYYLQHDPELWEDPEKFDPERFAPKNKAKIQPLAFQAFGAGPRNCVGMRFAMMELKLALARILQKYRLELCNETDKAGINIRVAVVTICPGNGVWVKAVPLA